MDNKEDIMNALEEFSRNPTNKIPDILERYFERVALTGETIFEWEKLKPAFRFKMDQSMKEFNERAPTDHLHPSPNVEVVKFEEMRIRLLNVLDSFTGAPFTIQRLCELITHPQTKEQYKRADKFMRGIEKNLMIVSAVDPFGNKIVSEPKPFINGLDSNGVDAGEMHTPEKKGSPFMPPPPANSPASSLWFNSVTPANSPVSSASSWHRVGATDASHSSMTGSPTAFNLQSSSFGENWPEAELDDYTQSPPEKKSRLSGGCSDSMPSSSNTEPTSNAAEYFGSTSRADSPKVSGSESKVSSAAPFVSSGNKLPSMDGLEALIASSCPVTSAASSLMAAVSSSSVTIISSSEGVQASDSLPTTSHVMDSTSTTEHHAASVTSDRIQSTDCKHVLDPANKAGQSVSASELGKTPLGRECSQLSAGGLRWSSEVGSTDSDSTSSDSDSSSSADCNVMKTEITESTQSATTSDYREHPGQSVEMKMAPSTSEDAVTLKTSQSSGVTELDESNPGCDSPSSPCTEVTHPAGGHNPEVSSSSELQATGDDPGTLTSTQSQVHSTGISVEIHSSANLPVAAPSHQSSSDAANSETMPTCCPISDTADVTSASTTGDACKDSTAEECQRSTGKGDDRSPSHISVVPSGSEHPEPMSTNSADSTPDGTLSSTSHGDSEPCMQQPPEHEPMDTN